MGILAVRNEAQKILFDEELSGQISDGMWENLNRRDHWQVWCDADVVVDPDNLGRDFWASYDSYNFTHPDLLSVVKDRMLVTVRLGLTYGADKADTLASLFGLTPDGRPATIPSYWGEYAAKGHEAYQKNLDMVKGMDLDEVTFIAGYEAIYSEADLMKDLRDLKKIKTLRRG
jgi:hypothetical protein